MIASSMTLSRYVAVPLILEVIPALPTPEELKADHDRRGAVIDRFLSNPADPHSLEELRGVLRELGWLRKK
jgi:hypothetical protein